MGQRLLVNVWKEEKILASSYYHWSGYSKIALEIVASIMTDLEYYLENMKNDKMISYRRAIVKSLYKTGARASSNIMRHLKLLNFKYGPEITRNRNNGLIFINEDKIHDTIGYCEMVVDIYIEDNGITSFNPADVLFEEDEDSLEIYDSDLKFIDYDSEIRFCLNVEEVSRLSEFLPNEFVCIKTPKGSLYTPLV